MKLLILYRWTVEETQHEAFRQRWRDATALLKAFGGLGSCLTRNQEGDFVAIAAWPDQETRDRAFDQVLALAPLPGVLRFEQERLSVEANLWALKTEENG